MTTLRKASSRVSVDSYAGKGVAILAMFPPDCIAAISAAVSQYGGALPSVTAGFAADHSIPQPFVALSDEYISNEDSVPLIVGLSTVLLYGMRAGWGTSNYKEILKTTFALPDGMAQKYASEIETLDSFVADKNGDGSTGIIEGATAYLTEGLRRLFNQSMEVLGADSWKLDQNQKNDVDFLLEFKSLGEVMIKLNERSRLIIAGGVLSGALVKTASTGETGDVFEEEGDVQDPNYIDPAFAFGDIVSNIGRRNLPSAAFGGLKALPSMGRAMSFAVASNVINTTRARDVAAGNVSHEAAAAGLPPVKKKLLNVIESIRSGNPAKMAVLGAAAGGLGTLVVKGIRKALKGDPASPLGDEAMGDVYEHIHNTDGPELAQAWLTGDVQSMARHIIGDAVNFNAADHQDEDLRTAMGEISDEIAQGGDTVDDDDLETGGLFTRWRMNRAVKRTQRRENRGVRRAARAQNKANLSRQRAIARSTYMDVYEPQQDQSRGIPDYDPEEENYSGAATSGQDDFGLPDVGIDPMS